ncbi:hypothetical protein [Streptomyces sp. IBSBF 2806]|uniref:hypothetical protein n=1 Tax=Streptomyces sp. IBSBF 2806 TaxID=2903529 RepID=UPI003FA72EF3
MVAVDDITSPATLAHPLDPPHPGAHGRRRPHRRRPQGGRLAHRGRRHPQPCDTCKSETEVAVAMTCRTDRLDDARLRAEEQAQTMHGVAGDWLCRL